MRIVCTDHYMTEPVPGLDMVYSEFRRTPIYRVPVLRVFGPTLNGIRITASLNMCFAIWFKDRVIIRHFLL